LIGGTEDPKVALEKLKAAGVDLVKSLPESDPNGSQLGRLATPWFHHFLSYDPRSTLARSRSSRGPGDPSGVGQVGRRAPAPRLHCGWGSLKSAVGKAIGRSDRASRTASRAPGQLPDGS
jgi:hypothetical protein